VLTRTETRFAGTITTETGSVAETLPVVIVNMLGTQADLSPDEARALSLRLIEAASKAENPRPIDWIGKE
jgi:hypothetical protein